MKINLETDDPYMECEFKMKIEYMMI